MEETCRYCGASEVVPVFKIQRSDGPSKGNKYRRFCTACERWLPMCSKAYFKQHPRQHVLPPDSSLEEKRVVPIDEFQALGGTVPWRNAISGRSGGVVTIPLNEQGGNENESEQPEDHTENEPVESKNGPKENKDEPEHTENEPKESEENTPQESQSDVEECVEKIEAVNTAVGMLVENQVVDEADAYQFLAGKLTAILECREG